MITDHYANCNPIISNQEDDKQVCERFIAEHGVINGVTFVTMEILKKYYDPIKKEIDEVKFYDWLKTRAWVDPKYPTTRDGKIDCTELLYQPRKVCKRNLAKFGFKEVPLTVTEQKSWLKRDYYKFQTPTYIAYVHQDSVDFIKEEHLYNPAESDFKNLARRCVWCSLDERTFKGSLEVEASAEYREVFRERDLIHNKIEKAQEKAKQRKILVKKIQAIFHKYNSFVYRTRFLFIRNENYQVLWWFFSMNLIANLFSKIISKANHDN